MESFVHLRKGTTPTRVHADLDGLKDDELGRGGFTGPHPPACIDVTIRPSFACWDRCDPPTSLQ